MQLSLMILNPAMQVFMEPNFVPKAHVDPAAYEEVLAIAEKAGYPAVDISTMEIDVFGAAQVRAMLEKHHLACGSVILFEGFADPKAEPMAHTKAIIDATAALGCRTLMLVAGFPDPTIPREVMRACMIARFREAVAYAADKNVTCCIEDFPNVDVPMSASADMQLLLDGVPGLRLVFDSANMMVMGEEPLPYLDRFLDRVGYYHLKDVVVTDDEGDRMQNGKHLLAVQIGEGIMDFPAILQRAKASGYEGYLSVEYAPRGEEWAHHLENVTKAKKLLEQEMGR